MLLKSSQPRKVVGFAQLCAIAKDRFLVERPATVSDWKESIARRLPQMGFAGYDPEATRRAMDAVKHANRFTFAPPSLPAPTPAPTIRELSPGEASAALQRVFDEVRRRFPTLPIATGQKGF